jgi:peroxiredoxin Q/BCP
MSKRIQVGDRLPDVELRLDDGRRGRLADLAAGRPVVVFFYPRDFTPVCTAEACGFRDNWAALSAHNAFVVGISDDSEASHLKFRERFRLPFELATDDGSLVEAFGIKPMLPFMKVRVTIAADAAGQVLFTCDSRVRASLHVDGALKALETLKNS